MTAVQVDRPAHVAPTVLFLDGLTGTGKTMMGPILATFDRVEVQRFEHIYEHVCALRFLGRIEEDAATVLIRMYSDLSCYNAMIGRETNFRWKDLSGVLSNPRGWRYLGRLLDEDGDSVMDRIERGRPIVHIASHQVLGIGLPLFAAIEQRLRVVHMVRHPLYLLEHWHSYIDRHGVDARDFTVWLRHGPLCLPWFAHGWEEQYAAANTMDRVIYTIQRLVEASDRSLAALGDAARKQVLTIPFERFVVKPDPFIGEIAALLGTKATPLTQREMQRQRVPRELTLDGRDLGIYRRYNWKPPEKGASEQAELKKRWDYAAREASPAAMRALEALAAAYEARHLQGAAA